MKRYFIALLGGEPIEETLTVDEGLTKIKAIDALVDSGALLDDDERTDFDRVPVEEHDAALAKHGYTIVPVDLVYGDRLHRIEQAKEAAPLVIGAVKAEIPPAMVLQAPRPAWYELKAIVEHWISQQGHDRCWYYPDLFRRIAQAVGISTSTLPDSLPPRCEFEAGCRRYQEEEYGPKEP